jgi:hypothetical protein
MERDAHFQSLFYISFMVSSKEPFLQVPFTELAPQERQRERETGEAVIISYSECVSVFLTL